LLTKILGRLSQIRFFLLPESVISARIAKFRRTIQGNKKNQDMHLRQLVGSNAAAQTDSRGESGGFSSLTR